MPILGFKLKKCIGAMAFVEFISSSIYTKRRKLIIRSDSVVKVMI